MKELLTEYLKNKYNLNLSEEDLNEIEKMCFSIQKHTVCDSCYSLGIRDNNCVCVESNRYSTIELEFKHCNVCNQTIDDPIDSEFNDKQLNINVKYQTVGRENGEFVVKGEFNTQKEALDLANKLNSTQSDIYYDWCMINI